MTLQAVNRSVLARRWFGVLVLLAFGLKALLPPGYMLAAVDGHILYVLCPAGLSQSGSMHGGGEMPPMAAMPSMHGMQHAGHASLAALQCPYAHAGGASLVGEVLAPAQPYFIVLRPAIVRAGLSVPVEPPLRHRAPRGPPALA